MAEGARLESVFGGNSNVGSNPTLSAIVMGVVPIKVQIAASVNTRNVKSSRGLFLITAEEEHTAGR